MAGAVRRDQIERRQGEVIAMPMAAAAGDESGSCTGPYSPLTTLDQNRRIASALPAAAIRAQRIAEPESGSNVLRSRRAAAYRRFPLRKLRKNNY